MTEQAKNIDWERFAKEIMAHRDNGNNIDIDGYDVQEIGVECGLLEQVEAHEPCEGYCACADDGFFPVICYRVTY